MALGPYRQLDGRADALADGGVGLYSRVIVAHAEQSAASGDDERFGAFTLEAMGQAVPRRPARHP